MRNEKIRVMIRKLKLVVHQIKVIWLTLMSSDLDLAWQDESDQVAGALTKAIAVEFGLQATQKVEPFIMRTTPLVMIAICAKMGKAGITMRYGSVTYRDVPVGKWEVVVRKIDDEEVHTDSTDLTDNNKLSKGDK